MRIGEMPACTHPPAIPSKSLQNRVNCGRFVTLVWLNFMAWPPILKSGANLPVPNRPFARSVRGEPLRHYARSRIRPNHSSCWKPWPRRPKSMAHSSTMHVSRPAASATASKSCGRWIEISADSRLLKHATLSLKNLKLELTTNHTYGWLIKWKTSVSLRQKPNSQACVIKSSVVGRQF